jgi:hypothetical protein
MNAEVVILCLFIIVVIFYLSFDASQINTGFSLVNEEKNLDLISFLTKDVKRVEKDYSKTPDKYSGSRYNISGKVISNTHAEFEYMHPLVSGKTSKFSANLHPQPFSEVVDVFGVNSKYILKTADAVRLQIPQHLSINQLNQELEKGCWYIHSPEKFGVNYKKLVFHNQSFCTIFSEHIVKELQKHNEDNYFNRVQATLNFVQHISYGLPDFDKNNFNYFGLATPPESFALNYADCDSKSVFFASILINLIDSENIVLVSCQVPEHHMMVAVKGLNIVNGQSISAFGNNYLLMETTKPCVIGDWPWPSFHCDEVIQLV